MRRDPGMNRGISWEQLHDQISELLPLLDPKVAQVARDALARGREVRAALWSADRSLEAALDQVTELLATLRPNRPESYILAAVQNLLLGLLPVAVLTTHLIAAWPKVQAGQHALGARSVPPVSGSSRGPGEGYWPAGEDPTRSPSIRHEAGTLAGATRAM